MLQTINLNNNVERELALEAQGHRRTRRWIGDNARAEHNGWYQARRNQRIFSSDYGSKIAQLQAAKPRQASQETIFSRIGNLFGSRYQQLSRIQQGSAADC